MKYHFDEKIDRRNTNSMKWDVEENELPMWVADMDFQTAPVIRKAIEKRAAHGIFGYTVIPKSWNLAYQSWWERRHHFRIKEEWLIFTTGIVPAISSIVRKLTTPAEKVLVQTPCFNIFFNSIYNNGRNIQTNPLVYDGEKYTINWKDLEEKLSDPQTGLMILCNPHNPVGKIWDRESLERIGMLCKKYAVTVLSDEIHCDLTDPGKEYIPFASVSETCRDISVTCLAPTKCFNLAGMQTAAVCVPNPILRHKVWRGLNTDEVAEPNAFAIDVTIAAFTEGEDWLEELRCYLYENKSFVKTHIKAHLPKLKIASEDATYLMWLDISAYGKSGELASFIRQKSGLYLSEGKEYGENGDDFLRINIACPKATVEDGMNRLKESLEAWEKKQGGACENNSDVL